MDNQTNTENKDAAVTTPSETKTAGTAAPVAKGPRGYTKHGYPACWCRKMDHDQCMAKLAEMVKTGAGFPFKCSTPPAPKTPKAKMCADAGTADAAPKTRKGYTKHGYPACWLRTMDHDAAMTKLLAQTASNPENGSAVAMERSATDSERTLEVAGVKFFFSQDHYNYILRGSDGGPKRYFGTFGRMLAEVRDRCLKATLHKVGNVEIMRLEDLITADKNVTAALRDFCAKEEAEKSK